MTTTTAYVRPPLVSRRDLAAIKAALLVDVLPPQAHPLLALLRNCDPGPRGCWEWNKATTAGGYALVSMGRERVYAHRYSYEVFNGHIPEAFVIDHLCENPRCVNPDHLEPVPQRVNVMRNRIAQQTHCKNGHAMTPENTLWRRDRDRSRRCKTCLRIWQQARAERDRAARAQAKPA